MSRRGGFLCAEKTVSSLLQKRLEVMTYGFMRTTNYDAKGNLINIITTKDSNEYELKSYNDKLELDEKGNPYIGILVDKQAGRETYFDGENGIRVYEKYDYLRQMLGINIDGGSMLSPLYFNPMLDTGVTATRLNTITSMESDIKNTNSNLYNNAFSNMISKTQQYALSGGNLDLSTFGDYNYWSSFEELSGYFDSWSEDINALLSPVSIDESSTYDYIISSVEDAGRIDDLKTKTHEMNIFFEFANQMALKAKGVITGISPTMFNLVKGLGIWTQDAYAFDGIMNNVKSNGINFLDKAYNFISDAGSLTSDKADILKETFWSGLKSGVNNVSSYFTKLSTFVSSVYNLAQGGAEIGLDTLKSLGTSAWQNIKTTAGEMKGLATYFKYMGSLALTSPDLPFAQGTLLSLIGGDTNTWLNLQGATDSAFNIANKLYDISTAFIDDNIDYAFDVTSDIIKPTWWLALENSIGANTEDIASRFGYVTNKAIDLLTTSKDVFVNELSYVTDFLLNGQQEVFDNFVAIGREIGLDFWKDPKVFLNDLVSHSDVYTSSDQKASTVDIWLEIYQNKYPAYLQGFVSQGLLGFLGQLTQDNTSWDFAVKNGSYKIEYLLKNTSAQVIWAPGMNYSEKDATVAEAFRLQLGSAIDGKRIVIAHSAGTESAIRSMLLQKADKYILMSPRMSPSALEKYARDAGVDMKDIIIIYAKNDCPNWGTDPIRGYDNPPANGWTTIYIEEDYNEPIGPITMQGHVTPTNALRDNHLCTISINGVTVTGKKFVAEEVRNLLIK